MTAQYEFRRYRGDGAPPPGHEVQNRRGQKGKYLADEDLVTAVNTALAVEQPLLVTGEPGTGKTELAWSVATELGLGPVLEFHTRSDHQARDALYTFDHLRRLFHVHTQDKQALDPENYVEYRALGEALRGDTQRVVLIDEIDKAPRDFPNDLLNEIDQMAFSVPETGKHFVARVRPVVIITSNSERQLPDAFLRRCVFHHLQPPDEARLRRILQERVGTTDLSEALCDAAIQRYQELRSLGLEKTPATAELVSWVRVLLRAGVDAAKVASEPELHRLVGIGTLIKHREDWMRLQRSRPRD